MRPDTRDDADVGLVEVLRRDAPDAVARLIEGYGARVYRLAMRVTGMPDDAEAVAGETLATVIDAIGTFGGEPPFPLWIDRIAARSAYRKLRARPLRENEIVVEDLLPPFDPDGRHFEPMDDWSVRAEDPAIEADMRQRLTAAIDELPALYRTAVVLHDVEGMSDADIADAVGIAPRGVASRVHRARLFLRQRLSEHHDAAAAPPPTGS